MRFLQRSLIGIFLLGATLALFAWAGNTVRLAVQDRMGQEPRSFPQRERVLAVNVVPVEPTTIAPRLDVFGEVSSAQRADLRALSGGSVLEISDTFTEGGEVAAGDILIRIDPRDAETALARAAANLRDADAELRDAERAIELAQDELTAAREQAELRDAALTRQRDLQNRGVGTAAAVEAAELAASSAAQSVLSRRQALANAEARVDQARTRLERSQLDVADAERTLEDSTIRAPFSGVLTDVTVTQGVRVTANERIAQLIDPTDLEVSFRLSAAQYSRLVGEDGTLISAPITAGLAVQGLNIAAQGVISRESAQVGEGQTGRVLFARLENAAGLRPGDFVTVSVIEPELGFVAMVPATAVAADGTVLVVGEENRLAEAAVTVLRRQGNDVIIRAPEITGQMIVAERSPLLGAGIAVEPIDPETAASGPAAAEMITLDPERRAKLIEAVQNSPMPDAVKARVLGQLEQETVPADMVARIEGRMGG